MALPAPTPQSLLPPMQAVHAGGSCLRVRRLGAGPRLVLLHGGPGLDHHVLLPLALPLARHFEVWLPDLPGHGEGAEEGRLPASLGALKSQVGRWLRGLPGGVPLLGGHSLGAHLVRELMREGVVAPRAAVLLAPPAGTQPSTRRGGLSAAALLPSDTGPGAPEEARNELLAALEQEEEAPPCDALVQALEHARVRRPASYGALLGDLVRALHRPPPAMRAPCPVLVLGGDLDRTCPLPAVASVAAATEGARLRVLRGCGHVPWWSGGEALAADVRGFLEEAGPPVTP